MARPPTDIQGVAERLVFRPSLARGTLRLLPALHGKVVSSRRGQHGLSLIETLVAFGVVGGVAPAVIMPMYSIAGSMGQAV